MSLKNHIVESVLSIGGMLGLLALFMITSGTAIDPIQDALECRKTCRKLSVKVVHYLPECECEAVE